MRTLVSILNGSVLTGIIVLAVVMLMINGEFDLSVGPILAMGGYLFGTLSIGGITLLGLIPVGAPLPPPIALLCALLGCTLLGVVNGLIVTTTRIPSFIATLGTLFIFLWLVSVYSGNQSFEAGREATEGIVLYRVFSGRLRDFGAAIAGPMGNLRVSVFWMIALALLMQFVLTRTRYGKPGVRGGRQPAGGPRAGHQRAPSQDLELRPDRAVRRDRGRGAVQPVRQGAG